MTLVMLKEVTALKHSLNVMLHPPNKNYETLFDSKAFFLFLHLLQLEPTFASFIWILLPSNEVFNFILPEVAWRLGPEPELFA